MEVQEVQVPARSMSRFAPIIGEAKLAELDDTAVAMREYLEGRTIWNVNSTGAGGGVAELLSFLLPYTRGLGVEVRWLVIEGDAEFFAITKRLCNGLYGVLGDGGSLGEREHRHFRTISEANAPDLTALVRPQDVVILHDPQTAGLASIIQKTGAKVLWRCHVGHDTPNEYVERSWEFLRPYLEDVDAFIFSTSKHVPGWIEPGRAHIIPPSIDPFSTKNFDMDGAAARRVLEYTGILSDDPAVDLVTVTRPDGYKVRIRSRARVVCEGPAPCPQAPLVVQVSRWDRLKDMQGVMQSFAERVDLSLGAHLALVGPDVSEVVDDPEAAEMFEECRAAWLGLPSEKRARIRFALLPMGDLEENAAVVNAVQRHASVIVQKSLAEGFGLTVTEAMWKRRPVVASAVGGITDQINHAEQGILLEDPTDLRAFAEATNLLLRDRSYAEDLGSKARFRAIDHFLADRHLIDYARLLEHMVA